MLEEQVTAAKSVLPQKKCLLGVQNSLGNGIIQKKDKGRNGNVPF